jgi:hypothetical protein
MQRIDHTRTSEKGIALLTALFALLLLSAIAVGMVYMANSETDVNKNYRDAQVTTWAARAGLEEVRARLNPANGDLLAVAPTKILPGQDTSGGQYGVVYVVNPGSGETDASIAPWVSGNTYFDQSLCNWWGNSYDTSFSQGMACTGSSNSFKANTTAQLSKAPYAAAASGSSGSDATVPWKWVRITLKNNIGNDLNSSNNSGQTLSVQPSTVTADNRQTPICWDGSQQRLLPSTYTSGDCSLPPTGTTTVYKPIWVLTSYATSSSGTARYAQMEVANNPPLITNASVDSQDVVVLQGSLDISGNDACTCKCTGNSVATQDFCASPSNLPGKTCNTNQYAIYSENTITQNGNGKLFAFGGSGLNNTTTSQNNNCQGNNGCFPYDVNGLIQTYSASAVNVSSACYTGSPTPCGLSPNAQGTFQLQSGALGGTLPVPFPPDYSTTQDYGTPQLTYFPSNVDLTATSSGNGVLIVDGNLTIHGGFNWYGLILVKGIVDFTGGGSTQNIWGAIINGTSISQNDTLGGSSTIAYDSCALNRNFITTPPKMISFRELSF